MKISDWISIISLMMSCFLFYLNREMTKKINNINLNSNILKYLVEEEIFKILPQKLDIAFSSNLLDTKELEDVCADIIDKLKIYNFIDKKFYNKIKDKVEKIDEIVVKRKNKTKSHSSIDEMKEIEEIIEKLYSDFMKKYLN